MRLDVLMRIEELNKRLRTQLGRDLSTDELTMVRVLVPEIYRSELLAGFKNRVAAINAILDEHGEKDLMHLSNDTTAKWVRGRRTATMVVNDDDGFDYTFSFGDQVAEVVESPDALRQTVDEMRRYLSAAD